MLFPYRAKNPPERFPWVTCSILAVNVLVFVVVNRGMRIPEEVAMTWGLIPSQMMPMTFVTSAFLHGDIFHLIGNMWFLYLFGFAVEGRLGWWKHLLLYFGAGLAGDLLHISLVGLAHPNIPSIGASGAIMGLIGAAIWMFPHAKIQVFYWFFFFLIGTFEVAMWMVGAFYIAGDLLSALLWGGSSGVANWAHLGGALGGFLIAMALRTARDSEETSEAKAVLADAKEYYVLSHTELEDLARTQPENSEITLHWAMQVAKRGIPWPMDLVERVHAHQKKMFDKEESGAVGAVFAQAPDEAKIFPVLMLEAGSRAEKEGNPNLATQLYQKAFNSPLGTEEDQMAAAFRNAMLMEAWRQNYAGAEDLYRWILQRWPMTHLESQIKARLTVVGPRAEIQRKTSHPV